MAPDRTVTLANWMDWPHNRTAFQRVRELAPTALISRRGGAPLLLPRRPVELDDMDFARADGSRTTWAAHLQATQCDAVCVVHRGDIVYERYFNGMVEHTPHLLMSVSKSFCGAALGIAIGRGRLSVDDLVCDVAPEFAGTSLDGATVRHVIDMTAGTDFVDARAVINGTDRAEDIAAIANRYARVLRGPTGWASVFGRPAVG